MDLITQLKEEHVQIGRLLAEAKFLFSKKNPNPDNLITVLRELQDVLVNHLKLEDQALYPKFENSKDSECNELGRQFAKEMKGIAKAALAFFKKYSVKSASNLLKDKNFNEELNQIIVVVKKRVKIEETILFPAFRTC